MGRVLTSFSRCVSRSVLLCFSITGSGGQWRKFRAFASSANRDVHSAWIVLHNKLGADAHTCVQYSVGELTGVIRDGKEFGAFLEEFGAYKSRYVIATLLPSAGGALFQ